MSFPRARNKRFNEEVGCGPGVGSYDPKFGGIDGAGTFMKGERFQNKFERCGPGVGSYDPKYGGIDDAGSFMKGDRFQKEFKTPASLQKSAKTKSASNIRDVLYSSKKQLDFFGSSESLGNLPEQENLRTELRRIKAQLEKEIQSKDSALNDLANEKIKVRELEEAYDQEVKLYSIALKDLNSSKLESANLHLKVAELTKVSDDLTSEVQEKSVFIQNLEAKMHSEFLDLKTCLSAETNANKAALAELDATQMELQDLKSKYSTLIRMTNNLQLDLEIKVRELQILRDQLESEITSLNNSLSSEIEKKETALAECKTVNLQFSDLNSKITEVTSSNISLLVEIENKALKLQILESEIDSLKQAVNSLTDLKDKSLAKLDSSRSELSSANIRNSDLIKENESMILKLKENDIATHNLENSNVLLKNALALEERNKEKALADVTVLMSDLSDMKSKYNSMVALKDEVVSDLKMKTNHLQELESTTFALRSFLCIEERLKESALTELQKSLLQVSTLEATCSSLTKSLNETTVEVQTKEQELQDFKKQFETETTSLKCELLEEAKLKEATSQELDTCKSDLEELQKKFQDSIANKNDAMAALNSKVLFVKELQEELAAERSALQSSCADLESKQLEFENLEIQFFASEATAKSLQLDIESKKSENLALNSELLEVKDTLAELTEKILTLESAEKENAILKASNLDEIKYLSLQLEEKNSQIDWLDSAIKESQDQSDLKLRSITLELLEMKTSLEAVTLSNDSQSEELEKKSKIVQSLKTSLDSSKSTISTLQMRLKQQEQEIVSLREQLSETSNSVQMLGLEKQELHTKCESLRINILFTEDSIQTLSAELRAKEDRITNLDAQRIHLEITHSELSYELDNVKSDLCNLAPENENLQRVLKERDLLVQELENKGLDAESEAKFLETELQEKELVLKSLESKWTSSIASLRSMEEELQAKDKSISNLEKSLQRTTSILQESLSNAASMDKKCQLLETCFSDCSASLELLKLELTNKDAQVEAAMASLHDLKESEMTLQLKSRQLQDQLQAKESLEAGFNQKLQQAASDFSQQQDILNSWKSKYESLEATVAPFKDQLDRFAKERDSLLQENESAYKQISDLSQKYAEHMGHQNHKQKIQYVIRMKEELVDLKKENSRLRALVPVTKPEVPKKPDCLVRQSGKKAPLKSSENTAFF